MDLDCISVKMATAGSGYPARLRTKPGQAGRACPGLLDAVCAVIFVGAVNVKIREARSRTGPSAPARAPWAGARRAGLQCGEHGDGSVSEHTLVDMADSAGGSNRGRGRLPTIVEVASCAGVSIATVSRVVSGAGRVREATRLRVEHAIAATGWTADPAARVLAGGTGNEVVLAIAVAGQQQFADDPHYARVIAGACQEAARHGLFLSVHVARPGSVASLAPFSGNRRHAGAILVNVDAEEAASINGLGLPLVSMGISAPSVPSVDPENKAGASRAIGHLLAHSRKRIATIAGPKRNPCARERLTGYRDCVRSAGLPEVEVSADFTRSGAARATRRLLGTHPDLDAIFVGSDLMATAVLQVLLGSGRRIPDDVAVVGFDDSPPAVMTTPALTTVYQPVEELAKLAVRTLIDPAGKRPLDQRMPTQLVVRASSAA